MKYWRKRLLLLWKFVKLIPYARELELECQKIEQTLHDLRFANDINPATKEKEVARQEGVIEGIKFCIGKFKEDNLCT